MRGRKGCRERKTEGCSRPTTLGGARAEASCGCCAALSLRLAALFPRSVLPRPLAFPPSGHAWVNPPPSTPNPSPTFSTKSSLKTPVPGSPSPGRWVISLGDWARPRFTQSLRRRPARCQNRLVAHTSLRGDKERELGGCVSPVKMGPSSCTKNTLPRTIWRVPDF